MLLELDLNDYLKIELDRVLEEDELKSNNKKHTELLVQLIDKKAAKAAALARKVLRWPIGQTLPTDITYDDVEEHLLVVGPTSEALLPFPSKNRIQGVTIVFFGSRTVNPVDTFDIKSVIKSIQNVIENPQKEKRWKQLTQNLGECSNGEASGALSAIEQTQLMEAIRKYSDDVDSDAETLNSMLEAVVNARILSFRNEDAFLRLCVEKEKNHVVEVVLNDSARVVSEHILAELLKLTAEKPEDQRRDQVIQVLSRNFSKKPMTEATAEVLTVSEAIEIMTALTQIYKEMREDDICGKALSLITVLMDAHGSRIVYEDSLHQKFATVSNFFIEMQSLVGTFSRLEAAIEETSDAFTASNVVTRIHPVAHLLNW
ncbi:Protein CBG20930 [Caenorhabditis briggsae]|uniref:Protein CBG20930 n=1 Tax=Caenorhabditis briggsae TaxID=6238 RepID=A8XYZ4_CAEBR|nr:Protein CBG20930 [Caenorhabditis briggsae]CAP37861.2 Protein CBG20930 [Caenorhabditis briggsae]